MIHVPIYHLWTLLAFGFIHLVIGVKQIASRPRPRNYRNLLLDLDELPKENLIRRLSNKEQINLNLASKTYRNAIFQKESRLELRRHCPGRFIQDFMRMYFSDGKNPGISNTAYRHDFIPLQDDDLILLPNQCFGALTKFCRNDQMQDSRSPVHFSLGKFTKSTIEFLHSHFHGCHSVFYIELNLALDDSEKFNALQQFIDHTQSVFTFQLLLEYTTEANTNRLTDMFGALLKIPKSVRHVIIKGTVESDNMFEVLNAIRENGNVESLDLVLSDSQTVSILANEIVRGLPISALIIRDVDSSLATLFSALLKHSGLRFLEIHGDCKALHDVHFDSVFHLFNNDLSNLESFTLTLYGKECNEDFSRAVAKGFNQNKSLQQISIATASEKDAFFLDTFYKG